MSLSSNPLVSVIVPIYNVGEYLDQCLKSLMNQTLKNIEIICIDDGSSDNSLSIMQNFAHVDKRFKIFSQANSGVSASRNKGIQIATGSYLTFVDGDDWLDLNMCEVMLQLALTNNADSVMCNYKKKFYNRTECSMNPFVEDRFVWHKIDIQNNLHRRIFGPIDYELSNPALLDVLSSSCRQLFKTELCKDIRFIDTKYIGPSEDCLFVI